MALPELTPEERQAALEKAAHARRARAEVKNRLRHSGASLQDVLTEARESEAVAKIKVMDLLQAMPGIGKITAVEIMERLKIAPSRRLRGLGQNQTAALIKEFARRG